jgi:hypothetical protein
MNGIPWPPKWHILAGTTEFHAQTTESKMARKWHNLADCAKIKHNLTDCALLKNTLVPPLICFDWF